MIFTSFTYLYFFVAVLSIYWTLRKKNLQNIFLLATSYLFYGWVHPWFLTLLAATTLVDWGVGIGIQSKPANKKAFLVLSLVSNLLLLGFFKYFNFFTENVSDVLKVFGFNPNIQVLSIFLPVGISFYTFQSLSYTIDIYRGRLQASKNIVDFALFVSFFPQLVAGPIERATHLLPQVQKERQYSAALWSFAIPLIIKGYLKKLVIADNVAVYADKVYMLQDPSVILLVAGTLAFALQIYADFSAYTDIARGSARLLGFDIMENFKSPYFAISPSDFWKRWHISFSSWIKDYLYIPLGGSRSDSKLKFLFILLISLGLSGLWHGAAWHFVFWGLFHGLLLWSYHFFGFGGKWLPEKILHKIFAWLIMSVFTIFGWMLFRTNDLTWLWHSILNFNFNTSMNLTAFIIIGFTLIYCIPLLIFKALDNFAKDKLWLQSFVYGLMVIAILIFYRDHGQDFIYFQF